MGVAAMESLERNLAERQTPRLVKMPTQLVVRQSTGPATTSVAVTKGELA
jgi:LacI family transcriptional regulator